MCLRFAESPPAPRSRDGSVGLASANMTDDARPGNATRVGGGLDAERGGAVPERRTACVHAPRGSEVRRNDTADAAKGATTSP